MDKKIDAYIGEIVSGLNCDEKEKREIFDEMKDHLLLLKQEYYNQGLTEAEATEKALECFGEQRQLTSGLQDSIFPYYKILKIGLWVLFVMYLLLMSFKLLLERIIGRVFDLFVEGYGFNRYFFYPEGTNSFFDREVWLANSNLIPFQNTLIYINGSDRFNLDIIINNTLGNILVFLPLGIFLPLLFKKYRSYSNLFLHSLLLSLSIEIIQFSMQIGQFDIDDIILNTVGAILGLLIYDMVVKLKNFGSGKMVHKTTN
ncbi:VanZ family protein [Bacillus marasmi]|uniref:VanZ family protein n=1 Tax=Bacillus marasmi TaxID=1926279 RepID=UPI0011C914A8|nr:VanZ family protein [Bacillus marasmi]